jgi:hypothetical protein
VGCKALSFGYDSKAAGQEGRLWILLWVVGVARECDQERPIVLIAHSFGGSLLTGVSLDDAVVGYLS